jgi:putative ABC transport system permease protein
MLMGIVGVTGATALILCGFGIMNSIETVQSKTFTEIMRYDAEIKLKSAVTAAEADEMFRTVENAESFDTAMSMSVTVYGENGESQTPYFVVLDDKQDALAFQDMNGNTVLLPDNGALITPRMAKELNAKVGDTIRTEMTDGTVFSFVVAYVIDFPVGNEIYMSKTAFGEICKTPYATRVLFVNGQNLGLDILRENPRVALAETKEEMIADMNAVLYIMQTIQWFLIVFSALLAFSVMMVLGRMNYYERMRELATLKVLGFRKNEMKRLVLRENIWVTVFALPFGVAGASLLLSSVLSLATNSDMEIQPFISAISVLSSFALILVFTLFVNFLMGKKFKGIDMVASLKSVE